MLLHAGVTDRRSWSALIDELGDGVRTVRYDARGYGDTRTAPDERWSMVADAVAVLDALGIERAVVVGASMGGATAVDLALAHPERVAGLVLIGAAVSGSPDRALDPVAARLDAEIEDAAEQDDLDTVNALEAHFWLDGPGHEGRVSGAARALFLDMNGRALSAADPGEPLPEEDAWPRTRTIRVPTAVVVGEYDLSEFHDNARHLAETIPGARLTRLPCTAHVPHAEGDDAAVRAIAALIGQVVRAAAATVTR
ncbi:MAG: alpha/beta hydrolase [Microbacterium sp.]|nr:alpha/beta hydrolase [Microbacterium sp.]